jgi:ribosomal protein S27E
MQRVEYRVEDNKYQNRLGLSIKYPENIRRKWSESDVRIECSECGSTNLDMDLSGELLVIACLDCPNYWDGSKDKVLYWTDDEEAIATVYNIEPFKKEE